MTEQTKKTPAEIIAIEAKNYRDRHAEWVPNKCDDTKKALYHAAHTLRKTVDDQWGKR